MNMIILISVHTLLQISDILIFHIKQKNICENRQRSNSLNSNLVCINIFATFFKLFHTWRDEIAKSV